MLKKTLLAGVAIAALTTSVGVVLADTYQFNGNYSSHNAVNNSLAVNNSSTTSNGNASSTVESTGVSRNSSVAVSQGNNAPAQAAAHSTGVGHGSAGAAVVSNTDGNSGAVAVAGGVAEGTGAAVALGNHDARANSYSAGVVDKSTLAEYTSEEYTDSLLKTYSLEEDDLKNVSFKIEKPTKEWQGNFQGQWQEIDVEIITNPDTPPPPPPGPDDEFTPLPNGISYVAYRLADGRVIKVEGIGGDIKDPTVPADYTDEIATEYGSPVVGYIIKAGPNHYTGTGETTTTDGWPTNPSGNVGGSGVYDEVNGFENI